MRFFFQFIILFISFQTIAQYTQTRTYTSNDGLTSNIINKVFVDSKNNLWVGSRAGLSVQKMETFEMVPHAITHKFNNIFDIAEDTEQGIWVAGYGQGILYIKGNKSKLITVKDGLISNYVRTVKVIDNYIYVGTLNGLSIISLKDFSIRNPQFTKNKLYDFTVTSFFKVHNKIYATTLNDGVFEILPEKVIHRLGIKKAFSSTVFKNNLYIGTSTELLKLDPKSLKIVNKYAIGNVWDYLIYKNELHVVSSGVYESSSGVYQLKENGFFNVTDNYKLGISDLKTIAYDRVRNFIFIGSQDNGLIQVNPKAPVKFFGDFNTVYCFAMNHEKRYVFHDKGLSILKGTKIIDEISLKKFKRAQVSKYKVFLKLATLENHFYPIDYSTTEEKIIFYDAHIHKDKLWVSTNLGMYTLNFDGVITNYFPVHTFNFTFYNNFLISAVPYGGVRIFSHIEKMKYRYYHDYENDHIPSNVVSMVKLGKSVFFASALTGLYRYEDGKFESLLKNNKFNEPKLKKITVINKNNLLVVTDFNDVYELAFENERVKIVTKTEYQDIKGSTTRGLDVINGITYITTNLGVNVFKAGKSFFIDHEQGFNNYNAIKTFTHGDTLFIGSKNGYFTINNNYFKQERKEVNEVKVSSIQINNVFRNEYLKHINDELILDSDENNIILKYYVTNTKYPKKLNFEYRLKETEAWKKTNDYHINLNYLNYGKYNIQLKIKNLDTGETVIHEVIKLNIQPPFYFTIPFILGTIIVLTVSIFSWFKFRIRAIKRKNRHKEVLLQLKTEKEKQELQFDKKLAVVRLQALKSQMNSHFLFNVMSSIQYYILSNDVKNALYYLERFSSLIRITLNYSDKEVITIKEEIDYLEHYLEIENLRAEHKINFEIIVAPDVDLLHVKIVPLLLQPFIENAIVHAFPSRITHPKIELKIYKEQKNLVISIKDNGIGYQKKDSNKTHESKGMEIVESRLKFTQKKFNNEIKIQSNSFGTEVIIVLDIY